MSDPDFLDAVEANLLALIKEATEIDANTNRPKVEFADRLKLIDASVRFAATKQKLRPQNNAGEFKGAFDEFQRSARGSRSGSRPAKAKAGAADGSDAIAVNGRSANH